MSGAHAVRSVRDFEDMRAQTLRRSRIQSAIIIAGFSALLVISMQRSEMFASRSGGDAIGRLFAFVDLMTPDLKADTLLAERGTRGSLGWWFYDIERWLKALWETFEMAVLSTVFGCFFGLLASFFASRNINRNGPLRFVAKRTLEAIRTLPEIIFALMLVAAIGVGPMAGVIALTISTTGTIGKLFSEINEEVDRRQLEALDAAGAGLIQKIRFGIIPQMLPQYISYALIRLEANLSAAVGLGIVGAGGIGIELERAINYTEYDSYLAILLLMVATISTIDLISEAIRHRLIGIGGQH
ncbi:MAG: phosphonate ABC transporter, permease protein PhnE [Sphingomonadaceae bacterium]